MNHAGIGYIDENSNIHLPPDILSPLSIVEEVMVWGMLYPPSNNKICDTSKIVKYDFVLSPIPAMLWGSVGRLKLRLKPVQGTYKRITEQVLKQGGSILVSESSRSAHSYDTWTMVITFDDLSSMVFVKEQSYYAQPQSKLEALKDSIKANCADLLYVAERDVNLRDPVRIVPCSAMAYFNHVAKSKPNDRPQSENLKWAYYDQFVLTCKKYGRLESADGKLRSILETIDKSEEKVRPCSVFAELDTNDINIRLALIPQKEEKKFFTARVGFTRSSPPATSKGVLNHLLASMPEDYCVWRLANRTKNFSEEREEGRTDFIIKDTKEMSNFDRAKILDAKINQGGIPENLANITSIEIQCNTLKSMHKYNKNCSPKPKWDYHVFISYSSRNSDEANKIYSALETEGYKPYLSERKVASGDFFKDEIRKALCGSFEFLLLYSKQAADSDWVKTEYGAAWALGKWITPIALNMEVNELPEWLRERHAYNFQDFENRYLPELKARIEREEDNDE